MLEGRTGFSKNAQLFGNGGRTFTLEKGQTPSHVVKSWNSKNPERKINLKALLSANKGVDPRKYIAGRTYKMPLSAIERNNPGNVRFYNQKWLGEIPDGLSKGEFSVFDTPEHGARAAIRSAMNIAGGMDAPTILGIMKSYSPSSENNTSGHAANISKISRIPISAVLDSGNVGQWVDFANGLFRAETGRRYSFTPSQLTNIVESARKSK